MNEQARSAATTAPADAGAGGPEPTPPEGASPPPAIRVLDMAAGYWKTQVIHATAKLGVADALASGPRATADVAAETGTDAGAMARLLRAAASLGLLSSSEAGYELTALGECLRRDAADPIRNAALVLGSEHYEAWGGLAESVRDGEPAFDRRFGAPIFEWMPRNPERANEFNAFMAELARNVHVPTVAPVDFSQSTRVVDIGGGTGTLLAWILEQNPHLAGVLFDTDQVIDEARRAPAASDLSGRLELRSGDFTSDELPDGDTYICSLILHDLPDAAAAGLLRKIADKLGSNGRFIAVEGVVPEDDSPHLTKLNDLNMLVMTGGRERTRSEFEALFEAGGLRLAEAVAGPTPEQALIGVRA